ncbi:MAG: pyridoxamine 5'-phosphate oxidase family protein [Shimia sp.]|uniref:pyridoxamine 5'-phosphate oxidase family protein n=1 Tax=Shimia sp. TaxID=1954381 RepID=UPI004058331D
MSEKNALKQEYILQDEAALRALFPPTHAAAAAAKCLDHLDSYAQDFIARAPFLCIGTQAQDGTADVSPRGDPCGFVKVLDDRTILIPDRPGNNRLDTLVNIVTQPSVGVLFMVPGFDETLLINGTAQVTNDPQVLALMEVQGRLPKVAIVVTVQEMYLHCAKAFRRAKLWDPEARQDRSVMPSLSKMILDQTTGAPKDPVEMAEIDADLEERYKASMY